MVFSANLKNGHAPAHNPERVGPAPTLSGQGRLVDALSHVRGRLLTRHDAGVVRALPHTDPNTVATAIAPLLPGRFSLTGTLERRLLLAESTEGVWTAADLSGQAHITRTWPAWTQGRISVEHPDLWLSPAQVSEQGVTRLVSPRVLLAALYHPEHFPLPRFPLAISDLARAARLSLMGRVDLMDMQLGITFNEIVEFVRTQRPDIVGVSATFGQHDLMVELLDHLYGLPAPPLVVVGGSLTVRNEALLLQRYPRLLVARGAGEPTIADVLGYFHGDLALEQVRGIGYSGAARGGAMAIGRRRTATPPNRVATDFLPELDLLDRTLQHRGVAQLEASRGCTNFCSFCPRGHKGTWAGSESGELRWMLHAISDVFERNPGPARTLYLVDEEFIGRGPEAVSRALSVADEVHQANFTWESSCRIDQVVTPGKDRAWHVERGYLWRGLIERGLRRMLFGVESGVTSVLERFNKETTSEQNALAIRTLSALGVPTRFTYITFDHLMSPEELRATHAFQARTDLLLKPLPELSVEEIVDGVRDPGFVAAHSTNRPFYTGISYMLVSMECLIGAAYTRAVKAAGLTGQARPSMGRVDADFADARIGVCSQHAQLWVDRNFALDYTLKSLEKIIDGPSYHRIRNARTLIKTASFTLLTRMLDLLDFEPDLDGFPTALTTVMDDELGHLRTSLAPAIAHIIDALPDTTADLLAIEHERWTAMTGWHLINSTDPCGT